VQSVGTAHSIEGTAAAPRIAARLGPDATVVTVLVDSGLKYPTTAVYRTA
jgi:cysteine synthase